MPKGHLCCTNNGKYQKWYHVTNSQKLLLHAEFGTLLHSYFQPTSQEISDWQKAPYEHNTSHPEHLVHKCISGNIVRSKSESLIDMLLYVNKIPYRYECALHFDEETLYPDFTILHPKTHESQYWEHFGMMDKPSYVHKNNSRLQTYLTHNIIPGKNLIITYETSNHPLDLYTIEKILQVYFL